MRSKRGGIVIIKVKIEFKSKSIKTIPQPHCVRQLPLHKGAYFCSTKIVKGFRIITHLWVVSNTCMAGRPIKNALVRRQYWVGLCPKMKYPPLYGGIFIDFR